MAAPLTPRRATGGSVRRRGRPPGTTNAARAARIAGVPATPSVSSEPPPKRRKYIPGGPGGGGRFVDEDGNVTLVVRGVPSSSTGPTSRASRTPATTGRTQRVPSTAARASSSIPRRERSTRTRVAVSRYEPDDEETFSSAAAVAAAVAQSEGYKPREERGWEEFHPNLDTETTFMVFRSEDVDGTAVKTLQTAVPALGTTPSMSSSFGLTNGHSFSTATAASSFSAVADADTKDTEPLTVAMPDANANAPSVTVNGTTPGQPETPLRRRIGRPVREVAAVPYGMGMTPRTPKVLPIHNQTPKEKLDLKRPTYRRTDRIQLFENQTVGRYVDKSMMNAGYQETDVYIRPERYLLKASDANAEEEVDAYLQAVADTADTAETTETDGSERLPTSYGVPGATTGLFTSGGAAGSNGGVGRVEYDMDEQDDQWLSKYNAQRKAVHDVEAITREIFEITITKIEKEWHLLEKRIPKPNPKPPQTHRARSSSAAAVNGEMQIGEEQDSKCAICDDGDCENTNAIVFCDGCDLAVHQDCYGVPFIPEGQWLCRKCQLIGRGVPTCIFCPNTDGAFKQTNSSKWAHMLCAMWIPETSLGNTTFMEPVMDVDKVPKTRWRLTCYLCKQKMGACIQCGNKACYQAFHVTCARRARLFLKMKNSQGALAVLDNSMVLKAFCDRHCPADYAKENNVHQAARDAKKHYKRTMRGRIWADSRASALQIQATTGLLAGAAESQMTGARIAAAAAAAAASSTPVAESVATDGDADADANANVDANAPALDRIKSAAAAKPMWKLPSGAPVIPQAVFDTVETALQRFMLRRRREFVAEACRYWTLKREARRGAALLKRLQLQMETFTSMELTRRNFAAMGPAGRGRLERRIGFAEALLGDLEQLRTLAHDVVVREDAKRAAAELESEFVDATYFPVAALLWPVVAKASCYDNKNVFGAGFGALQAQLDARHYTTTLAFVRALGAAVHAGIGPDDDADARDRRRLGKRILKSVQPLLEAAARAEANITHAPVEPMLAEIEAVLAASVAVPVAVPVAEPGEAPAVGGEADEAGEVDATMAEVAEVDTTMAEVDTTVTSRLADADKTLDSASTSIEVTPRSLSVAKSGVGAATAGTTAAKAVKTGSIQAPDAESTPLTPPPSHNGSLPGASSAGAERPLVDTLDTGGVLWYLGAFEPAGTTAHDADDDVVEAEADAAESVEADTVEADTADAVEADAADAAEPDEPPMSPADRQASEDLTDMDEDELRGLANDVELAALAVTSKKKQTLSVATPRRRAPPAPPRKGVRSSARRR